MKLTGLPMRFAAVACGLGLLALIALGGAKRDRAPGYIQIDFSMNSRAFQGLEVEIDGESVGKLEMVGSTARNAFGVAYGIHEVRVLHPAIGCRTATVELEHPGQRLPLLLNIGDMGDGTEFFFDQ